MAEEQHNAHALAWPASPQAEATAAYVREHCGDDLVDVADYRGETTLVVRPAAIERVCRALYDAPALRYTFLSDITAVDWPEREPRFEIVYHLMSLETRAVIRLKVRMGDDEIPDPEVPTVTAVWPAANFFEREIFDLFGIRFAGHPHLTRIVMPQDWVGHPLRKDYPLTGIQLPEPHWGGQVPFNAPLPKGIGRQTLRTADGTEEPPAARDPGEPKRAKRPKRRER